MTIALYMCGFLLLVAVVIGGGVWYDERGRRADTTHRRR